MTPDLKQTIAELRGMIAKATPGPWKPCRHLESPEADAACPCGYRGVIFAQGAHHDAYAICQPGHELPRDEEQWGSEPPRFDRRVEIANMGLIVSAINALPMLLDALESTDTTPTGLGNEGEQYARLRYEARFLANRIADLDWCDLDDLWRDWGGHVAPPLHRMTEVLNELDAADASPLPMEREDDRSR